MTDNLPITKVVYNLPRATVYFTDGDVITVDRDDDYFDEEKSIAVAIAAKMYGLGTLEDIFTKFCKKQGYGYCVDGKVKYTILK